MSKYVEEIGAFVTENGSIEEQMKKESEKHDCGSTLVGDTVIEKLGIEGAVIMATVNPEKVSDAGMKIIECLNSMDNVNTGTKFVSLLAVCDYILDEGHNRS